MDARVLTMATPRWPGPHDAPWLQEHEALLWQDGLILATGSSAAVAAQAHRLGIEPRPAGGRVVVPGFVDAHTHFLHIGVKRTRPDLSGCTSRQGVLDALASWLAAHPGDGAVIGELWDESGWTVRERPHRRDIDAVVAQAAAAGHGPPDRRVVLRRVCGHVAVAGSAALPEIRRRWDSDDLVDMATGVLLEQPSLYLNEVMPESPDRLDLAVEAACRASHRLGITAVGDYSQAPYRAALLRAAAAGRLSVRVASSIYVQQLEDEIAKGMRTGRARDAPVPAPGRPDGTRPGGGLPGGGPGANGSGYADLAPEAGDRGRTAGTDGGRIAGASSVGPVGVVGVDGADPRGADWLRDGGLKVFLDGSLGARTAALREPYLDDPGTPADCHGEHRSRHGCVGHPHPNGTLNWSDADVERWFTTAAAAGIQVHAHAIGDAAIDQGLDMFRRLAGATMEGARAGEPRGAPLGPVVEGGLRHRFEHFEIHHDEQLEATARLGVVASSQPNFVGTWSTKGGMYEERLGRRFLLNNRFRSLKRHGVRLAFGSDGMPPGPLLGLDGAVAHPVGHERLEPLEAIWHYTWASAWSLHWEDQLGSLEPGKAVDLVILDTKDLGGPPSTWGVHATFVDGRARFDVTGETR